MQARILLVLEPNSLREELKSALKSQEHQIFAPDNRKDAQGLLREGPWDVVVGHDSSKTDLPDDIALLADALTTDLFTQVVFLGTQVTVRTAVELMRAGAWSVLDTNYETLENILETIEQAIEERREDLELVRATES